MHALLVLFVIPFSFWQLQVFKQIKSNQIKRVTGSTYRLSADNPAQTVPNESSPCVWAGNPRLQALKQTSLYHDQRSYSLEGRHAGC